MESLQQIEQRSFAAIANIGNLALRILKSVVNEDTGRAMGCSVGIVFAPNCDNFHFSPPGLNRFDKQDIRMLRFRLTVEDILLPQAESCLSLKLLDYWDLGALKRRNCNANDVIAYIEEEKSYSESSNAVGRKQKRNH